MAIVDSAIWFCPFSVNDSGLRSLTVVAPSATLAAAMVGVARGVIATVGMALVAGGGAVPGVPAKADGAVLVGVAACGVAATSDPRIAVGETVMAVRLAVAVAVPVGITGRVETGVPPATGVPGVAVAMAPIARTSPPGANKP